MSCSAAFLAGSFSALHTNSACASLCWLLAFHPPLVSLCILKIILRGTLRRKPLSLETLVNSIKVILITRDGRVACEPSVLANRLTHLLCVIGVFTPGLMLRFGHSLVI